MLKVEEWIEIRELARRKISVSEIARQTGRDRKTVRKVLGEEVPTTERVIRHRRASKLDPYRDYLRQRIEQGCLNGAVLLEEITGMGYTGKESILRDFLTPLRQERRREREATTRFETAPGKQAQVDWGAFGRIWVPRDERWRPLSAFVFTLGYSRAMALEFVVSCDMEHFVQCHLNAFGALGIPETILYDNLKTGILGRQPDGTPIVPGRFLDFALAYGFTPKFCQPYRPRTKGKVERSVGYVRQNFWVRVSQEVTAKELDLVGLNERARAWVNRVANARVHGTHGEVVAPRYAAEHPFLGTVGTRPPYDTAYHAMRRVGRDGRVSYHGEIYHLPLSYALQEIDVTESLTGEVTLRTRAGQVLRPLVGMPTNGRAARSMPTQRTGAAASVGERPRLHLVGRSAPVVETRDLAVYEEVAHGRGGR